MSRRVLCKFFAHGACLKGEHCEFSHDWRDPSNDVCTYYQKGACSYGSRCRYNHVRVSRSHTSIASSSTNSRHPLVSDASYQGHSVRPASSSVGSSAHAVASNKDSVSPTYKAWNQEVRHHDLCENDDVGESSSVRPGDKPICSFAAAGHCPHGEKCPHLHGDVCPTCGKQCLHPLRPDEREEHLITCEKKQQHLDALKQSQEIECSVCLERVLSKPTPAERKFGLLSECDHPFCISCIRNWRSSSPTTGMDLNSALRACPICRKLSYFVIPSVIWYSSKEEKQEIVESYKAKLRSIDCKYFDFGNANCPFGTSCFYKHTVKPGSYTWNNLKPPPRRRSSRTRFNRGRSNTMDMADMLAILEDFEAFPEREDAVGITDGEDMGSMLAFLEHFEAYSEMEEVLENFSPEDLGEEVLTPAEVSFLLGPLGLDTEEVLTRSEMALLLGQLGLFNTDSSSDD